MSSSRPITFVAPVGRRGDVLENNFLASPCFCALHQHQILIQENFASAALAYNDAISRSTNDLIVFAHQDVLFPDSWIPQLESALEQLELQDPDWGVLGCYGAKQDGGECGYVYSNGQGIVGMPFKDPESVQTLDEIVLILRKSSGLRFDERLPHFHLYGAGICLAAANREMKSYVIPAFCIHNTHRILILPDEFYECYAVLKKNWKSHLPIHTPCIRITRFNVPMYRRKLYEARLRYIHHREFSKTRVQDVGRLLKEVDRLLHGSADVV